MSESEIDAALVELDQTHFPQIAKALSASLSTKQATLQWRILCVLETASISELESSSEVAAAVYPFLNDASHARRSMAMNILVNLGDASVPLLENGLKSESGRVRSGCVAALNRIDRLTEHATMELCQDSDPRVRYQAVLALKQNESSVQTLVKAATDEEPSVAWLAISRLGKYPELHELIVPHLIPLLNRKEVASQAAISLARFGADSAAAIPALIQVWPLGVVEGDNFPTDAVDIAISRIGKPRIEDLNQLISLLELKHPHQRALAASCIGKLGLQGNKASDHLRGLIGRELELDRLQMAEQKKLGDDFPAEEEKNYSESASAALFAYWCIADDREGFQSLLIPVENANCYFFPIEFWDDIDVESQTQLLRIFLDCDCESLREEALDIISDSDEEFFSIHNQISLLKERDRSLANEEGYWNAYARTVPIGTSDWEEQLCESFRIKQISIKVFATVCRVHGFKKPQTLQLLKDAFVSSKTYQARIAFDVFLCHQDDPIKALLELHRERNIESYWILNWIKGNFISSPQVFDIVRSGLRSDSQDLRSESLALMGRFKDMLVSTPAIVERLQSEFEKRYETYKDGRRDPSMFDDALAMAIHQLSGDPACVTRLITLYENLYESYNRADAYANGTIASVLLRCENWDERFDPYVIRGLESQHPHYARYLSEDLHNLQDWIEVGLKSKNEKVKELIHGLENSKDDLVSKATKRAKVALNKRKQ